MCFGCVFMRSGCVFMCLDAFHVSLYVLFWICTFVPPSAKNLLEQYYGSLGSKYRYFNKDSAPPGPEIWIPSLCVENAPWLLGVFYCQEPYNNSTVLYVKNNLFLELYRRCTGTSETTNVLIRPIFFPVVQYYNTMSVLNLFLLSSTILCTLYILFSTGGAGGFEPLRSKKNENFKMLFKSGC